MQINPSIRPVLALTLVFCCPPAGSFAPSLLDEILATGQLLAPDSTRRLYEQNGFVRQWNQQQITSLLSALRTAREHGLDPGEYHYSELQTARPHDDRIDVLASDAFLVYAGHLLGGKVRPTTIEPTWSAKGRERDLVAYLKDSLVKDNIATSLDALGTSQPRYRILMDALDRYRKISEAGGWGLVPPGEALKPGARSPRIPALRNRLSATGDIPTTTPGDAELYDEQLVAAVRRFQRRTNLEPDGIAGPATIKHLNLTPQDRVDQIRVNLERWRWLPANLGDRHIRVNIADYRLEAHENNDIARTHDVIVGRNYRKTPVFSGNMTYCILNPWWETPSRLARLDKLPVFQKSPGSVDKLGFQVLDQNGNILNTSEIDWRKYSPANFPFRLRQKPGPHNALGKIKFMLPNKHDVYLHDTPTRELFDKTRRNFSSGCIRVKDPVGLAEWTFQANRDWPRDRIEQVIESGKETRVTLKQPVQTHILYWTAVSDDDNNDIRFIEDIYERDPPVLRALDTKTTHP
ncbi:MAG: L,D-transpeptidase family protein [Halobacteria archaeon]|nr:L,D-transpeptidase family protein [Halobacteria archaeon]